MKGGNVKRSIAFLIVMAWSGHAAASSSFPAAVDQHLMLMGMDTVKNKVAPPDGCLLCHVTENGGNGTNNAFGVALKRAGAVGTEANTVGPALDVLVGQAPRAVESLPPQPEHGCSVGAATTNHEEAWCASFVALALLASRAGRRATRGHP
jgi:hypothetical protein